MVKVILILLLTVVGCSHRLKLPKEVSIDQTFIDVVDDFVIESKVQKHAVVIDNLIIRFSSNLEFKTKGECWDYNRGVDGTPTILVNSQAWPYESIVRRKIMLYHELGHCVLWRDHLDTYLPSGYVTSIMYSFLQIDEVYLNNWSYYMWELFKNNP